MSEKAVVLTVATEGLAAQTLTAGMLLRRARESAGLHVAALAVSMKVPVKKLEALEADRLDLLPDAVFVRALASSVCRALKIDPAPVLQLLPQTSTPRLDAEERGINTPFHAAGDRKARALPDFMSRPAVLWVGALLLGALVVVFFPESNTSQVSSVTSLSSPAKEVADVAVTPVVAPAAVQPDVKGVTATPDLAKSADVSKFASEPLPAVASPATAAAAGIAATPASAGLVKGPSSLTQSTPAPAASGQAGGLVTFKAKGETWVEVTDAKGVSQVRKILAAGEVASASGTLPLSVVVGRADMTVVEVRGQAFSLDAITKENVARFEVK
jgi:cytoskeleton protein RodZ